MTTTRRPRSAGPRHRPWPGCRQCRGIALDLGSARTRAWSSGNGLVFDVPTVAFGNGTVHPVQRGAIVDTAAVARMLDRLLGHRLPRSTRPLLILTTPALGTVAFRTEARAAAEILRPHTVLTVPAARAVAVAADADLARPLLVVDIGAHVTDVVLLDDGAVTDAHRTTLGTSDMDRLAPATRITDAIVGMVTAMREQDHTSRTHDALRRGVLLAGGGALRPHVAPRLAELLRVPVKPVPTPHTAAVRGAATLLRAVHNHPCTTPPPVPPR
ncbi:rod shape-determining protein [Streptomyces europaeiscabiei]|uniref:rod shape-determining protein n=2 Tax=Streptomyces europaeiscabiei TaxID=146819 RepID=UPI000765BD5F|nr:rod shape-determining protein [Streptomyces europaeiscabiei]MDX3554988.1 rod shape-determining protein [Streptomyces europaeiscabiei]MDX3865112.1 rod shape-determining protein [Streptomyces europaeiscabiei]MDX3872577.1 rod shape-determining protein [Streptomyces europaeiscabiei]